MAIRHLPQAAAAVVAWLVIAVLAPLATSSSVEGAPASAEGLTSNPSYSVSYLGRDGPDGADRYRATFGWGGTFFGIAVETMPLVPAEQSVGILMDGYRVAFPGRPLEDVQPGDGFDFFVPAGTLVCTEFRLTGTTAEYRSLRGDSLTVHNDYGNPILYRLVRAEHPSVEEIAINQEADLEPNELAEAIYGRGDPNFKPDFLQVARAREAVRSGASTVEIDIGRTHLDDLWDMKGAGEPGGKSQAGLDIYWFRSEGVAQPLFRVDDGVGENTDLAALPSAMRVYYYKDGVVRTYVRLADTTFLSGRQPRNEEWAKVYAEHGRVDPAPIRWEIGQPESDEAAEEMNELGVAVLRFQPREPPRGNFFTRLLDALFALMNRKDG